MQTAAVGRPARCPVAQTRAPLHLDYSSDSLAAGVAGRQARRIHCTTREGRPPLQEGGANGRRRPNRCQVGEALAPTCVGNLGKVARHPPHDLRSATLTELLPAHDRVALWHLDVEGAELDVLDSAAALFAARRVKPSDARVCACPVGALRGPARGWSEARTQDLQWLVLRPGVRWRTLRLCRPPRVPQTMPAGSLLREGRCRARAPRAPR